VLNDVAVTTEEAKMRRDIQTSYFPGIRTNGKKAINCTRCDWRTDKICSSYTLVFNFFETTGQKVTIA